jgi:uncharacterized membrane protein YbhN (UPF0104 family)
MAAAALLIRPVQVWMAVGGAIAAVILAGALVLVSKGEQAAGNLGHAAARIVRRLRPTVDPNAWAAALIRFQKESAAGLVGRVGRATAVMIVFIVVDASVLVVCLRFVGIPGEYIGYLSVLAAVLSLYPLTIFPFAGLGVLDASLIVLINAEGVADSADLVAALVIWRTATLLLPLLPGLLALTRWRARQPSPTTDPVIDSAAPGETA